MNKLLKILFFFYAMTFGARAQVEDRYLLEFHRACKVFHQNNNRYPKTVRELPKSFHMIEEAQFRGERQSTFIFVREKAYQMKSHFPDEYVVAVFSDTVVKGGVHYRYVYFSNGMMMAIAEPLFKSILRGQNLGTLKQEEIQNLPLVK